jgi:hypothetical protein
MSHELVLDLIETLSCAGLPEEQASRSNKPRHTLTREEEAAATIDRNGLRYLCSIGLMSLVKQVSSVAKCMLLLQSSYVDTS